MAIAQHGMVAPAWVVLPSAACPRRHDTAQAQLASCSMHAVCGWACNQRPPFHASMTLLSMGIHGALLATQLQQLSPAATATYVAFSCSFPTFFVETLSWRGSAGWWWWRVGQPGVSSPSCSSHRPAAACT
uniref:Uncharacterized protein n=1 Tax=Chlamydomonas euryale TaxID=1486919 RepID=A0A7R9YQP2_9CHLO|mmetsp:Transcript_11742/g.34710  ORF Transcript_11742/g.34710 Transcript_11742/m.34710 type:complete len:131 (+) Transcript_11742:93-485(+)|eukprot:365145-Chlamydomonas_euryale.AAC.4